MRGDRSGALIGLLAALAFPGPAWGQDDIVVDFDPGWIDMALIDAGEVVVQTDRLPHATVSIDVAIAIDATQEEIWDLLTSCEIAPEVVPNVVDCTPIDIVNGGKSRLYNQTVKPIFFIPTFEHVFRMDYLPPDRIDIHHVSGRTIDRMDGTWRMLPYKDGGLLLVHSLELRPGVPIPRIFVRATLKRDLPNVLREVRRRAEAASGN
jgi:hypothetical protein